MQNLIFEMANYSNFSPEEIVTLCRLMLEIIKVLFLSILIFLSALLILFSHLFLAPSSFSSSLFPPSPPLLPLSFPSPNLFLVLPFLIFPFLSN